MANQTIYPYGQGGQLPSGYPIADDLNTDSAQQALSARQGVVLDGKILDILGGEQYYSLTWRTGDITNTGAYNPNYANKCTTFIKTMSDKVIIDNPSDYSIKVSRYDASQAYLGGIGYAIEPGTTVEVTLASGTAYIILTAYDQPGDEDVVDITAGYYTKETLITLRQSIDTLPGAGVYSNPVLGIDNPDPCAIDGEDGYFYMFNTGTFGSKKMMRSTNILDWEEADSPFTSDAVSECLADLNVASFVFWAPELVKVGNKYNLYISKGANPLLVFQSDHPNFGYEYKGQIITTANGLSGDNIDACVRYDLDGTLWMFWGSTYGIYRQKLSADGLTLDTEDTKEHVAGKLVSQDSSRETVFEGAYLYRRKGYWYLFVSAGNYINYTYKLKVGRSATLGGTFLDKDGNNMVDGYATTILSSANGDTLYGPGHNGAIFTDRGNRFYMLYHSHYTGAASSSDRPLCLQELFWDANGWPYFGNDGKPQIDGNEKPSF